MSIVRLYIIIAHPSLCVIKFPFICTPPPPVEATPKQPLEYNKYRTLCQDSLKTSWDVGMSKEHRGLENHTTAKKAKTETVTIL